MGIQNPSLNELSRADLRRAFRISIAEFLDDGGRLLPVEVLTERGLDRLAKKIKISESIGPNGRAERCSEIELWDRVEVLKELQVRDANTVEEQ